MCPRSDQLSGDFQLLGELPRLVDIERLEVECGIGVTMREGETGYEL
jgi:hypothetical protein